MISVDFKTVGTEAWCKHRIKFLLQRGFIKSASAAPNAEDIGKRLDEQFSEMRKTMPIQVSALSKLTNASRQGMTLNYSYEDRMPAEKWMEADKKKLLADVIKAQCEGKNTRLLLDLGYSIGVMHFDESGHFITHLYIDKSKCG